MRTLRFIVEGQIIKKDPTCDFEGLVPGTEGFLQAEFSFSPEWRNQAKIAAFYSPLGKEYPPQLLRDGKTCTIPSEALKKRAFKVQIVGHRLGTKITTDKVVVKQNGGKV
jgi:hypothetical protein